MLIHDLYPSSKVAPDLIRDYGWQFVENIPTITNESGRLAPTVARSEVHTDLRAQLDKEGVVAFATDSGEVIEISDFAVAESPSAEQTLGFFALK